MVQVTVYRDRDGVSGFQLSGHSGFADAGEDIVCSALSVMTINCMNSVEALTEDVPDIQAVNEEEGFVHYRLVHPSHDARLLLDSLVLGLTSLQESYGEHIEIRFEED